MGTLRTSTGLRVLSPADLPRALALLAREPLINVFVEHRTRQTGLDRRTLGGEMWGYERGDDLVAMCHAGANLVPVCATSQALASFAERAVAAGRICSSIVGPCEQVDELWDRLRPHWGPERLLRDRQPFLVTDRAPDVEPDPGVRLVREHELDVLYPASVAMFTEEVGVSPEIGEGRQLYRARVRQLISRGFALARIEDGRVVFKAEIGAVTPTACQVQGVWVDPQRRGEGISAPGMAAVVNHALRFVAPVVTLYVNRHNELARRAYARVGFEQTAEFTTVLF